MRQKVWLILFFLLLTFSGAAQAQQTPSAAETAEKLRAQLIEVQTKEDALRARAEYLDEALRPENIEHSLAGIGSTKPEELREARRRNLQKQRDGVEAQLTVLETSRLRLESAILDADARAYQQSARKP
jgi:low affinity Fe/Cu permease